jgi:hypothetical protein
MGGRMFKKLLHGFWALVMLVAASQAAAQVT